MDTAEIIVAWLGLYLLVGVVFTAAFVLRGAALVDPAVNGAGLAFRLLIFPGSVALWPILALRWRRPEHEL